MEHKLADGNSLYYEIHGNPSSKHTILFLNGLSQSTIAWTAVVPRLSSDHRIILCDLLLQGRSSKPDHYRTYDQHAHDVADLIALLKPSSLIVCGISYGGAVAQHLAVNHPEMVKGLILVSTFAHKTAHFNAIGESWKSALIAGGYPLMLDVMLPLVLGEDYFEDPLIPLETLKEMRVSNQPEKNDLLKLMMATENRKDYREDLRAINSPTLILHGNKDLLIPVHMAEELQRSIPGSSMKILENKGHTLNLEAISELSEAIRDFSKLI